MGVVIVHMWFSDDSSVIVKKCQDSMSLGVRGSLGLTVVPL